MNKELNIEEIMAQIHQATETVVDPVNREELLESIAIQNNQRGLYSPYEMLRQQVARDSLPTMTADSSIAVFAKKVLKRLWGTVFTPIRVSTDCVNENLTVILSRMNTEMMALEAQIDTEAKKLEDISR